MKQVAYDLSMKLEVRKCYNLDENYANIKLQLDGI